MSGKPRNPDAFPTRHGCGMTLLDYFAGQALAAYVSLKWEKKISAEDLAFMAYADARAMLKERSK